MKSVRATPIGLILLAGMFAGASVPGLAAKTPQEEAAKAQEDAADAQAARAEIRAATRETLSRLYAAKPEARAAVEGAAGYAVFSNFGMKFLVTGTARGKGIAYDAKGTEIFMKMAEVQAGLGFGVKKFRQVWIFETPAAYRNFVDKGFEFGAQAQATAKSETQGRSYSGAVLVSPGVWVYQLTDKGVVAELTVKGTKYYRDKDLN